MNIYSFPKRAVALCAASLLSTLVAAQSVDTVLLAQANPAAQVATPVAPAQTLQLQDAKLAKRWSVYWGWNRSTYSDSDIHFSGQGHDFTLKNVKAQDLQAEASLEGIRKYYLNPLEISIPQTNLRIAYQLDKDTAVALNLDHMKYVVTQEQSVAMSGCYTSNGTAGGAQTCNNGQQVIGDNWLNYEHTDGLNVLSLEYEKQYPVAWFGDSSSARMFGLVGLGVVLPKTNATMHMIGQVRNDEFHLAGWSAGVGGGFEKDFWKDYFFRTAFKVGYVDLPDVLTSSRGDKASQSFYYNELLIAAGVRF